MKTTALAAVLALAAAPVIAEPVQFDIDPSHAQIVFSWSHGGLSTTSAMFSGYEGQVMFDEADPAASSVSVEFPVAMLMSGWDERDAHLLSADFLDAATNELVSFTSTSIEVTGDTTALITGDLTVGGVTNSVVLDTVFNGTGEQMGTGTPLIGFTATTSLIRSEFDAGAFAPFVGDELDVMISFEAVQG